MGEFKDIILILTNLILLSIIIFLLVKKMGSGKERSDNIKKPEKMRTGLNKFGKKAGADNRAQSENQVKELIRRDQPQEWKKSSIDQDDNGFTQPSEIKPLWNEEENNREVVKKKEVYEDEERFRIAEAKLREEEEMRLRQAEEERLRKEEEERMQWETEHQAIAEDAPQKEEPEANKDEGKLLIDVINPMSKHEQESDNHKEERLRLEEEERLRKEAEEQLMKEKEEAHRRLEEEERLRREEEDRLRQEEERLHNEEEEERLRKEEEDRLSKEEEERLRKEAEEQLLKEEEEAHSRLEEEEKLRREEEDRLRQEEEERLRKEAEEQLLKEEEEARRSFEEQEKQKGEDKEDLVHKQEEKPVEKKEQKHSEPEKHAGINEEDKIKLEEEARLRAEIELRAKMEAEYKLRAEMEEKERLLKEQERKSREDKILKDRIYREEQQQKDKEENEVKRKRFEEKAKQKPTFLVVDDARFMRNIIRKILEEAGYEIIGEAESGKDAIRLAEKLEPTVITMDITMPDMDGIAAVEEILKKQPWIKVIMCSAADQKEKIVDAIKVGAQDFISKPFEKDKALAVVQKVLNNLNK